MREAVLMLYGEYENDQGIVHPWEEDMFHGRHELRDMFREYDVDFHLAVVHDKPNGYRELGDVPRISIAENPIYDENDVLQPDTKFVEGSLEAYPAVIDHWVKNFQDKVPQPDGSTFRTAYGLGVPNERLWNCRPIQNFGNSKVLMETVLKKSGVGIPTYEMTEIGTLVQEHPRVPILYKPADGSLSKGIEIFDDPTDIPRALRAGSLAKSGILQPFLDLRAPMKGLVAPAGDHKAAQELAEINTGHDRLRELRLHTLAYTDSDDQIQVEAYPTLKYSHPGTQTMQRAGNIALATESVSEEEYAITKALARQVILAAAEDSGESVTQYYGTFDWVEDKDGRRFMIDANCRGPRLTRESTLARQAFTRVLAQNAHQNMR